MHRRDVRDTVVLRQNCDPLAIAFRNIGGSLHGERKGRRDDKKQKNSPRELTRKLHDEHQAQREGIDLGAVARTIAMAASVQRFSSVHTRANSNSPSISGLACRLFTLPIISGVARRISVHC